MFEIYLFKCMNFFFMIFHLLDEFFNISFFIKKILFPIKKRKNMNTKIISQK